MNKAERNKQIVPFVCITLILLAVWFVSIVQYETSRILSWVKK